MKICVTCRKEMRCTKTGKTAVFHGSHVYRGDEFECPKCKAKFMNCNQAPTHDPDALNRDHDEPLNMDEQTNEQNKDVICICCGGSVKVVDTWARLSEEDLKDTKEKYPDMQFRAQCDYLCRWAYGPTEVIALTAYAHGQRWGAERIAVLERRDLKLTCLEGVGVDNWVGYGDAIEMMEEATNGNG